MELAKPAGARGKAADGAFQVEVSASSQVCGAIALNKAKKTLLNTQKPAGAGLVQISGTACVADAARKNA